MKSKVLHHFVKNTIVLALTGIIAVSNTSLVQAFEGEMVRETVKAGFFAMDAYHVQDEEGIKSGYGYDFFKMAETYHNWRFEFVGYELGWSDMLTMLDNGEIDVVTFAQKTPEREEKYDFSEKPVGTGDIVLSTTRENDTYVVNDYASYNGMTVGIMEGSTHIGILKALADKEGFTYTPKLYQAMADMKEALLNGDIDTMVSSSERTMTGERVLEDLAAMDYYAIVKKGNTELLDKINTAMDEMDLNNPSWRTVLSHKYFSSNDIEEFSFNKAELDYIEQLESEGKVFTVVTNPDLAPYSSYDKDGKPKGIAPTIFEEIADRIGLQYEFVSFDTYQEYNQFVKEGRADIDLTVFSDYGLAERNGITLSTSYMSTTLAILTKDVYNGNLTSIAEMNAAGNNTTYTEELLNTVDSIYYDTHAECIEAVASGKADATYLYTYTAQKAVEEDERNRLHYSIMPEYDVELAMGVHESMDYRMIMILNEGIRCLEGNYIQYVIQNEIARIAEKDTFISLIYDYPVIALGILGILIAIIFLLILFTSRMVNDRKERAQAQEVSRFMGYVCEANEMVIEVNLNTMRCTKHNMVNGVMVSEEMPYEFYNYSNKGDKIHPEDFVRLTGEGEVANFYELFTTKNKQVYFEARSKDQNGDYRWYSYTVRGIPKSRTHPNNFVLFKKNIDETVRKNEEQRLALEDALQAAKSASRAKGQFLSRMSHEIRTPLNAVIGYMEIAKYSKENTSKMIHCVENSEIAARHLLHIINDVLDISSIESGKLKIAHEEFDLKGQITTISTIFFNQAQEKKVKFDVTLKDVTEEWVIGDSLRVNQILMNLLSNAVKFTSMQGKINLTVQQLHLDEKRVYMLFMVTDTGIGMSEEYQGKLFTPFEQESATTAQKYGGSGLGLSITYNLVQMMGGKIEVESKVGEGTCFKVNLYFDRSGASHTISQAPQDYSHVRALIVDDDEAACDYMKSLFKRCKVKSDITNSGEGAIKQIKRRMDTDYKYDLCIVDWNMPGMNGIETAKRIKQECGVNIPIIIATAYDVNDIKEEAREAGVDKVIAKPLFQSTMFDLLVSTYGRYEPVQNKEQNLESIRGLRVLLAEDNPMNLEIALEILKKAGLVIDPVMDGEQALMRFTKQPEYTYDAILMDVQMPVMDGYQATAAIRSSDHPEAKSIPIIAMTANAFAEDVSAALASGMNGHISKPIDYSKLYAVLNQLCNVTNEK